VRTVRAAAFALAIGCTAVASAQQSVDLASISGRVTDATGGVLPDVEVMARHLDTNITSTVMTGADGRFRLPSLRIGRYQVTVHRDGFRDSTRQLTLNSGAAFELTIELSVAAVDTQVTVTATTDQPSHWVTSRANSTTAGLPGAEGDRDRRYRSHRTAPVSGARGPAMGLGDGTRTSPL